jgi:hypothetical protein
MMEYDDHTVTYEDTAAKRKAVFDKVVRFFLVHQSYCQDSVCQKDNVAADSLSVLADLCAIIDFDVEYHDD